MKDLKSILIGYHEQPKRPNIIKTVTGDNCQYKNEIIKIAHNIEQDFTLTDKNKKILNLLFLYFIGSKDFPELMYTLTGTRGSLNKGNMLVGGVGVGKTLFFKIFKDFTKSTIGVNSYQSIEAIDIINEVTVSGASSFDKFTHNKTNGTPTPITFYIDDIASKNENVKHFGTDYNVIEHLLYLRYNVFSRYGILTHTSTNIYPAQMKNVYDIRTIDRFKEMFNIIELDGLSWRK